MLSDFQQFVTSFLKRGNINKKYVEKISDNLELFKQALIHKSQNPKKNYEVLEFYGDSVINYSVIKFLRSEYPQILNIKYLTRIKHMLMSKGTLAGFALQAQLDKFILINPEVFSKFDQKEKQSLLEDVFEAFFGALKITADKLFGDGLGNAISFKILKSFFREVKFSIKYEELVDPKTRYKEFCDKRKWNFTSMIKVYKHLTPQGVQYKTTIFGLPVEGGNLVVLNVFVCDDEIKSQYTACENALKVLKEQYNLYDEIPDPYKQNNKCFLPDEEGNVIKSKDINISFEFKTLINNLIKTSFIKKDYEIFAQAFTHESANPNNYEILKCVGDNISTSILSDYIRKLYPDITDEVITTRLKHNFMYKKGFSDIAQKLGFSKFILVGDEYHEKIKDFPDAKKDLLQSVLQAFFGAIDILSTREGFGYYYCKKILFPLFADFKFSTNYDELFDPKTRLKELCDMKGWKFAQIIETKEFVEGDDERKIYETTVYGYPKNVREILSIARNQIKMESQNEACETALSVLRENYNIAIYRCFR